MSATAAQPLARQVLVLTRRLLEELLAEPAPLLGTVLLAPGYLAFQDEVFGRVAAHAHGIHGRYLTFIVPGAVLVATIAATNAGFAVLRDRNDGYLERLLTMPLSRVAIVAAPLLFGAAFAVCNAATVLAVAAVLGSTPVTGIAGIGAMLAIAALSGLSIAGLLVTVALLTSRIELVQLADLACFPLLFLSPLMLPRQDLGGWLQLVTAVNPTTYGVEGLRAIMREGWGLAQLWPAFAAGTACAGGMLVLAALAARRVTALR
jgi:ABC-2 type transport system permease protein